ncbi:MAG: hypothetical protein WBQ34_00590 [Candidatus Acidiferrales bacterium]
MIARISVTRVAVLAIAAIITTTAAQAATGPSPQALAAFNQYVSQAEAQIQQEEGAPDTFLGLQAFPSPSPNALEERLRRGEIVITSGGITPVEVPGGLVHHWVGIEFIPQTTIARVFAILQNYDQMARYYSPDVAASHLVKRHGDDFHVSMRLREHKIITVMLDGLYDVKYGRLDDDHQYCASHSMQMVEVSDDRSSTGGGADADGEDGAAASGTDHGFLWRTNAYWRFQQADGGVFVEFESISLSRDVPAGWGWMIEPFIRDVPRESLLFTLRATRKAVLANNVPDEPEVAPLQHRP